MGDEIQRQGEPSGAEPGEREREAPPVGVHPLGVPPSRWKNRRLPLLVAGCIAASVLVALLLPDVPKPDPSDQKAAGPAGSPPPLPVKEAIVEPPAAAPMTSDRDCDDCPRLVEVPAGSFVMGSSTATDKSSQREEQPAHTVTIGKPFLIGRFEITFDEWHACVADGGCNGYEPFDENWGRSDRPVINVDANDVFGYLRWLSHKTGRTYRLPTEAEWEYAARAGTTTPFWWGPVIGEDDANCRGCGIDWGKWTVPIGRFQPNPFGLHDVSGNVWEWVADCWFPTYKGAPTDGSARGGTETCTKRTIRGGSWDNSPPFVRSAVRAWGREDGRSNNVGFRVARDQ